MHGDEYQVVEALSDYLSSNKISLPDHFYIPTLSPSAVELKTRRNKFGHDLNRSFGDNTKDPEALKIISELSDKKFDLALDFHEDPELTEFYMYDSGKIKANDLESFKTLLITNGIGLFTGIDDEEDPLLGFNFEEGYASFPLHLEVPGSLGEYTLKHGITKRIITLEIPGRESLDKKEKAVKIIFESLLKMILNF